MILADVGMHRAGIDHYFLCRHGRGGYFAVAMSTVMPHTGSFAVVAGGGCISCFELDCRVCIFFKFIIKHREASLVRRRQPYVPQCIALVISCALFFSWLNALAKCNYAANLLLLGKVPISGVEGTKTRGPAKGRVVLGSQE